MNRLHRFSQPIYKVVLTCMLLATPLFAQSFATFYSFDGTDNSGSGSALIQGTDGNLYGTTIYGGPAGQGTVYKITPGGTLTTIYNFCALTGCADGAQPYAPVVQGFDGNLYGTSYYGGSGTCSSGCGTVFKLTLSGVLTTLHNFTQADGFAPQGGLTLAADGNFYGSNLYDSLYKITPTGMFTLLHGFTNGIDGSMPYSAPIQASDGNFYGVTYTGGASGSGVVYKLQGTTLTTLYSFCSVSYCSDGAYPLGGLIQAADGKLYGTTALGGNTPACDRGYGCGTIFSITLGGALTTLYTFHEPAAYVPLAAMVQGSDGALYGTTQNGGFANCSNGCGTLFRITTGGTFNHLYSFCGVAGCPDGELPQAGPLLLNTNGTFYGTTPEGGASGGGTIYTYSAGFPALVKSTPVAGATGMTVRILGTDLTGASSVTFNGTPAAFTVVSASEITTTVPAGATSGKIQVVTSSGTLSAIQAFHILP